MIRDSKDTIAAVATAPGEGGIGIVRISGDKALEILERVFVPMPENPEVRKLYYGHIQDPKNGKNIDEVLTTYMKGPRSYTAEDVVEIQCHGSIVSLRKILDLALREGARLAERGEFTKRAFLNGRLDLSQAEAVMDLIKAKTDTTFNVAMNQLEGVFSKKIRDMRADLVDALVNLTVNIDYPDEDIEELTYEKLYEMISQVKTKLDQLLATAHTGRIIREGLRVSIVGKPNVGKSSLMNALIGADRAIVTDIPGTTRDTIEENITVNNIPVVLTDTAGIRETEDIIEKIGIEKSKEAFNKADLVILVLDGSQSLEPEDLEIIRHIGNRKVMVLLNKQDQGKKLTAQEIQEILSGGQATALSQPAQIIETVLSQGQGIDKLTSAIENLVYDGKVKQGDSLMVTNARHKALLDSGAKALEDAMAMTKAREPLEFIEIDVNSCYQALGEIIGETASDIIDKVFERFCLGK